MDSADLLSLASTGAWPAVDAHTSGDSPSLAAALVRGDALGRCVLHYAAASAPRPLAARLFACAAAQRGAAPPSVTLSGETPLHWLCDPARALVAGADAALVAAALAAGVDAARRSAASGASAADALRARVAAGAADAAEAARCLEAIEAALAADGGGGRGGGGGGGGDAVAVAAAVCAAPPPAAARKVLKIKLKAAT
jgi:hypothetical protein